MIAQREADDPERIGSERHDESCDCESCYPTKCTECGDGTMHGNSLCRACQAIEDGYAGVVDE